MQREVWHPSDFHPPGKKGLSGLQLVALVVIALLLVAAGALSFVPTQSTPIDLIVAAQSASLQTADEEVVLPPFLADEITVVGSGRVEGIPGLNSFTSAVTIVTSERSMPLTLQSVRIARGTSVTLRRYPGIDRTFDVAVRNPEGGQQGWELVAFAREGFQASSTGRTYKAEKAAAAAPQAAQPPQAVRFAVGGELLLFRVKLAAAEREWAVRLPVRVSALSFFDVEAEKDGAPRLFSTIASGSIRFEQIQTLDGRETEMTLRSGQPMHIAAIGNGYLRQVRLTEAAVHVEFSGDVGELRTEASGRARDHMPSYFAYLSSRDDVRAVAAVAGGLGALLTLLNVIGIGVRTW